MEASCQGWKRVVGRRAWQFHLHGVVEEIVVGQTFAPSGFLLPRVAIGHQAYNERLLLRRTGRSRPELLRPQWPPEFEFTGNLE